MPSYGSLHSPSIRKMEYSRAQYGRKRVSIGNIIGDPFALATLSIAAVRMGRLHPCPVLFGSSNADILGLQLAWIIAFVSTVIANIQAPDGFQPYTYWTIVFYLVAIIGVFIVIASDSTQTYHVAVVGYLGCGLVLSTVSANTLIHFNQGAKEAAGAGYILLAMVTVRVQCWLPRADAAAPSTAR